MNRPTMPQPAEKAHWTLLTISVNALHSMLTAKPAPFRIGYQSSAGGILNAYREGDLCFEDAVEALMQWKARA